MVFRPFRARYVFFVYGPGGARFPLAPGYYISRLWRSDIFRAFGAPIINVTIRALTLGGVPQHGEEMTRRAGDDEEVPDEMVVANPLCGKEREATGVRNPTPEYQKNPRNGYQ